MINLQENLMLVVIILQLPNFNIECVDVDNLFQCRFGCIKKVCQIIIVIHTSNEYMGQELCHSVTFLIEEATGTGLQSGREAQWQQARGWIVCLIFSISSSSSHFDKWSRVVELIDAFLNGRLLFNFSLLPLAPASVLLYLIFLYNFVESRTRKQCFNTWHLFLF